MADTRSGSQRSRHLRRHLSLADRGSGSGLSRLRAVVHHDAVVEPGHGEVRRARAYLWHGCHLSPGHGVCPAHRHRRRHIPDGALPARAASPDRHCHRIAGRHSEHHLRHLGTVFLRPLSAGDAAAGADRDVRQRADPFQFVRRTALRHRRAHGLLHSRDHGAAVHYCGQPRCL